MLDSVEVIATVIRSTNGGLLTQMAQKIKELKDQGIDAGISLRRNPDGFYSSDLAEYVGVLKTFGLAVQRSPLRLSPEGVKKCEQVIRESYSKDPEITTKMSAILGLDIDTILKGTNQ
jgi:hypothetical protein